MSLFVAGAIFGEVGVPVFVACAPFGAIWGDSRSAKCCFARTKRIAKMGRVNSAKGQVRDDEFILGLSSELTILLQAQYLVMLLRAVIWTFHVLPLSNLNVLLPLLRFEPDASSAATTIKPESRSSIVLFIP